MRVCVRKWGLHQQAMENCLKNWVTNDVGELQAILKAPLPWCSPELDDAANGFADCLRKAGADVYMTAATVGA